jgi:hypothetical protein
MTDQEMLRAAADYIETYGLHKGDYFDDTYDGEGKPPCCGYGALRMIDGSLRKTRAGWEWALTPSEVRSQRYRVIRKLTLGFLGPNGDDGNDNYASWNDAPDRTKEEVCEYFRWVADHYDELVEFE